MNIWFRITSILVLMLLFLGLRMDIGRDVVLAQTSTVDTTNAGLSVKVAPGELLPISVKMSNFGGGQRVDVEVMYLITSDKNVEVYRATETVAVETTSNFVKTVQIPLDTQPGTYKATTSILYQGQVVPANTGFSFQVEKKILGVFQSEFLFYGGLALLPSLLMVLIGYNLIKHRTVSRFNSIDYTDIPGNDRVFYELISDTVMGMRQKVGDRALEIASNVEGLEINRNTGRIVKLTQSPSKIIAELVSEYEKTLGKRVSFSFRKTTLS